MASSTARPPVRPLLRPSAAGCWPPLFLPRVAASREERPPPSIVAAGRRGATLLRRPSRRGSSSPRVAARPCSAACCGAAVTRRPSRPPPAPVAVSTVRRHGKTARLLHSSLHCPARWSSPAAALVWSVGYQICCLLLILHHDSCGNSLLHSSAVVQSCLRSMPLLSILL